MDVFDDPPAEAPSPPATFINYLTSYSDCELITFAENHPDCRHPLVQEILTRLARRTGHVLGLRDRRSKFQREQQNVRS